MEHSHPVAHDVEFGTNDETVNVETRELLEDPGTDDELVVEHEPAPVEEHPHEH